MHFQIPFCWGFLFAFSKSHKNFYILKSDWRASMTNAMNSWFCYKRFIFVLLLNKLLCNSTEVATIANWKLCRLLNGELLKSQTLTCADSKCSHCASRLRLPFDILQVMTMVNAQVAKCGERTSRHIHQLTMFVLEKKKKKKLPFSVVASFLCDRVCQNLSQPLHALVRSMLRSRAGFSSMTAWTIRCDDPVRGCSALFQMWPLHSGCSLLHIHPVFSSVFFCQSCSAEVLMYKSMFLVLSAIGVKLLVRSTAIRVQSSVSCIFLM